MSAALSEHLMADGPDLDAPETRDRWRIDDDTAANWALRKLAAAETEKARIRHEAQAEISRVQAWADDAEQAISHDVDFFTGCLVDYRHRLESADPKLAKTYKLPAGSIARAKARRKVVLVDADALMEWALDNDRDLLTVRPARAEMMAAIGARYDLASAVDDPDTETEMVVVSTGEQVPGVRIVRGADTYSAKPNTDGGPF